MPRIGHHDTALRLQTQTQRLSAGRGTVPGQPAITLVHPQQVQPELDGVQTGDAIEIQGTPPLRISGSPEIPGGTATVALAVNAIPRVLEAAPGLWSMAELPPAAAIMGDARALLRRGGSAP